MMNRNCRGKHCVSRLLLAALVMAVMATPAMAHCDSEDGPIIPALRTALADGNLTPALKWIRPSDELQVVALFDKARAIRTQSEEARAIADQHFIETFIRLHRAGEGASFTGIKPAGSAPPIMMEADKSLALGDVEKLASEISKAVADGVRDRFKRARELQQRQDESVDAGRAYVESYVTYVHFVEGLHESLAESGGHPHIENKESCDHNPEPRSQNMDRIQLDQTVGEIVTKEPQLSRVFEEFDIDYCCGGKVALSDACRKAGLDPGRVLTRLEAERDSAASGPALVNAATMTLTQLADHIELTHHAYVKSEAPRLMAMAQKVASVHGEHDRRLSAVRDTVHDLISELTSHMMKEEHILFPMIRQIDARPSERTAAGFTVAGPIRQMEAEHEQAGSDLERLALLTDGYTPPEWACNTYRAFLDGLRQFESDLHQHVHKENNILFPRAMNGSAIGRAE